MAELALIAALWGNLVSLVAVGLVLATMDALVEGTAWREVRRYEAFVLCTLPSQPDEAVRMAASLPPAEIRRKIEFLKQHRLNVFASDTVALRSALPDPALPTLPVAARTALTKGEVDKKTGLIAVAGWAIDDAANDVVGGVCLEIDGVSYAAYYGRIRDDVAGPLKNERLTWCGFLREFSPGQLGVGRHQLAIKVLTKDRSAIYAPSGPFDFTIAH